MDMEARVPALEEAITAIKLDLAVLKATVATKEDLHKEMNAQTWRLVTFVCGFGTALVGATYFLATHIK